MEAALDEKRKHGTTHEKLMLHIADEFIPIPQTNLDNAVKAATNLLQDPTLRSNTMPEVIVLKQNMTMFLERHNRTESLQEIYETSAIFIKINKHYMEMPEDKKSPASRIIIELLNKHGCKRVAQTFINKLDTFYEKFDRIFEDGKQELKSSMLEWYKNYKTIKDLKDKMIAILEFMYLE